MVTHYATLTELVRWLNGKLAGAVVDELYSQTRDELIIAFDAAGEKPALRISIEPHRNFIYLLADAKRARRNSVDLFPAAAGKALTSVSAAIHDRIVFLNLGGGISLAVVLYGSSANVLLLDRNRNILDAFAHAKEIVGNPFSMKIPVLPEHILSGSLPEFSNALKSTNQPSLRHALKTLFPAMGRLLIDEVLFRTKCDPATPLDSINDAAAELIRQASMSVYNGLARPMPRIYYRGRSPVAFSVVPLMQFPDLRCEEHELVNDALRLYISGTARDENFEKEFRALQHRLKSERMKVERTIAKVGDDHMRTDRVAAYERFANLLLTQQDSGHKAGKTIELDDPLTAETVPIALDPGLTLMQNATRYFERAKKAKAGRRESEARLVLLEKSRTVLHELEEALEGCTTVADVKEFMETHRDRLQKYHMIEKEKGEEPVPFRIFRVVGGFEVWAGKSSANNDELTLHYAKPNDLWFHARGSGGSHVILRTGTGNGEPSKEAKEQAAAIAAYYSKQKNAKYVPVAMAEKKYVRKPKGAAPGSVVMEREKILMVRPGLPEKVEE